MENLIKKIRDKLDNIEKDAEFRSKLMEEISFLLEARGSNLIRTLGKWDPETKSARDIQGEKLAKRLHRKYGVNPNADVENYSREEHKSFELKKLKSHFDNIMIFQGPNGWAAMKPSKEYLEPKLIDKGYNPSEDKKITYYGFFELENPSEYDSLKKTRYENSTSWQGELESERGGNFSSEKAEVEKPTVADLIKLRIGPIRKVYRLDKRDLGYFTDDEKNVVDTTRDPEIFMGQRGSRLRTKGSVARQKMNARDQGNFNRDRMLDLIVKRIPKKEDIVDRIYVELLRDHDDENNPNKNDRFESRANKMKADLKSAFTYAVRKVFENDVTDLFWDKVIGDKIKEYKDKHQSQPEEQQIIGQNLSLKEEEREAIESDVQAMTPNAARKYANDIKTKVAAIAKQMAEKDPEKRKPTTADVLKEMPATDVFKYELCIKKLKDLKSPKIGPYRKSKYPQTSEDILIKLAATNSVVLARIIPFVMKYLKYNILYNVQT